MTTSDSEQGPPGSVEPEETKKIEPRPHGTDSTREGARTKRQVHFFRAGDGCALDVRLADGNRREWESPTEANRSYPAELRRAVKGRHGLRWEKEEKRGRAVMNKSVDTP